ncbi:MAG TPA: hypothetical protein VHA52_10105 [Candidatus Babeliaceae bacterium]|nr:hypothetical protein [Candidatus Babeliaceae bacterium]
MKKLASEYDFDVSEDRKNDIRLSLFYSLQKNDFIYSKRPREDSWGMLNHKISSDQELKDVIEEKLNEHLKEREECIKEFKEEGKRIRELSNLQEEYEKNSVWVKKQRALESASMFDEKRAKSILFLNEACADRRKEWTEDNLKELEAIRQKNTFLRPLFRTTTADSDAPAFRHLEVNRLVTEDALKKIEETLRELVEAYEFPKELIEKDDAPHDKEFLKKNLNAIVNLAEDLEQILDISPLDF